MGLHKWLAAETPPAGGEILEVAVNRAEFLKLRRRTRMPVMHKSEGQQQQCNLNKHK
jgi:hypothetical protein